MPRGDVSAVRRVPGGDERLWVSCGAPLGACPSCGELVMLGRSFSRFCGCRRALAREHLLDRAVDVPPAELRVRAPVLMGPRPEAPVLMGPGPEAPVSAC